MITARTPSIAAAALEYYARGWKPVPVNRKTKKPIGTGWQKRPFDAAKFNAKAENVAMQLGAVSRGLVDVDLDSMLAVGLAPGFLPPTDAIFGRRSKPCSHQLYLSDLCDSEKCAAIQFREFTNGHAGQVIVELRIGGNSKGAATVVPPSMHETGETVEWERDDEPAHVAGDALKRAVTKLAVACVLMPRYPGQGSRHEGALVLGGVLVRAGWPAEDIEHLVRVLAGSAGDDEVTDRTLAATGALSVKANGGDVAGFTRLAELWGKDAADTLAKWGLAAGRELRGDKGAGLEDSVALAFAEEHAHHFRFVAASSQWIRLGCPRWEEG